MASITKISLIFFLILVLSSSFKLKTEKELLPKICNPQAKGKASTCIYPYRCGPIGGYNFCTKECTKNSDCFKLDTCGKSNLINKRLCIPKL